MLCASRWWVHWRLHLSCWTCERCKEFGRERARKKMRLLSPNKNYDNSHIERNGMALAMSMGHCCLVFYDDTIESSTLSTQFHFGHSRVNLAPIVMQILIRRLFQFKPRHIVALLFLSFFLFWGTSLCVVALNETFALFFIIFIYLMPFMCALKNNIYLFFIFLLLLRPLFAK